ncbi:hypothetical protein QCA50_012383 [Cerrena zonata]|uniref:Fungal-type protein kinase domain-containing protein n=1 Tax=Cerrena zonata TaxID=2478898 RepID=A0AAW0G437_9APHY
MVYFPRFWGGLPFPPSRLVHMSVEMNMGRDPIHDPPTEIYKRFYSEPQPAKSSSPDARIPADSSPTPLSASFNELSMRGADDALVKMALMQVLQDKTDVNYDIVKFIQHTLGFTPDDIPERAVGYMLDEQNCKSYSSRTYHKLDTPHQQDFAGERACCHAFQDIVWDLVRQLQPTAKDTRSFPAKLMFLHDHVVQGDFASYKPDFGYGAPIRANKHRWEFLGACGEMKKTRASHYRAVRNRPITMARIKQLKKRQKVLRRIIVKRESSEPPKPPKPSKPPKLYPKPPSHRMTTRAGAKRKAAPEPVVQVSKKRKAPTVKTKQAEETSISPPPDPRKRQLIDFSDAELQMAKYINELLSHGIRSYAFGFLVQETRMSLWYVDRMGMATSQSFDIFQDPELFLLVIAALHFANRHQLGVIPLVKYPDGTAQSHNKATLELPRAVSGKGTAIKKSLSFRLRVTPSSPLVVAYGAIGRGTTVVPITAEGHARKLFGDDKLVAKMSWPSVHRKSEATIIRVIRKKVGEHKDAKKYLENIVDLKCSLDMSGMEVKLPRAFMDLSEPYEPRLLRTLIMKQYLPLENIRSLNDFKTVYKDIFGAHHWVYKIAGILHRDPSLSNFLFYYDNNNKVVGILADWDVASSKEDLAVLHDGVDAAERPDNIGVDLPTSTPKLDDKGKAEDNSKTHDESTERRPRYRTGTGPFMALDLLTTTKIVHRYRHDLESFFYILCYFCSQFRPATIDNPDARFEYLHGWESGNTKQVYSTKYSFLGNHDGALSSLFQAADKEYFPLFDEWIWPLHKAMFRRVASFSNSLENSYGLLASALEQHEDELVEEYMKEFRDTSKNADSLITYEKFWGVLSK